MRVHGDAAEIPFAFPHAFIAARESPVPACVVRAIDPALLRIHDEIHAVGITRRNRDTDAAEPFAEGAHFIVHRNAQSLERQRRRVDAPGRVGRKNARNDPRKLRRTYDGLPDPCFFYGSCNCRCPALFPVCADDMRKLVSRKGIHQVCRVLLPALVHTHIERTVEHEAEAPLGGLKMKPGHAQIKQHAVDRFKPEF